MKHISDSPEPKTENRSGRQTFFLAVLFCITLFVMGCAASGLQAPSISVDSENVFHSNRFPKLDIKINENIKLIQDKKEGYHDPTDYQEIPNLKINEEQYYFLGADDPEQNGIKVVSIEIGRIRENGYWNTMDFTVFPGLIEKGFEAKGGKKYQYGIILDNFSINFIDNDRLAEARSKLEKQGPMKMLSKIYARNFGVNNNGILTVCYSESIPEALVWHRSSPITGDRRAFLEGFEERCDKNMVILE